MIMLQRFDFVIGHFKKFPTTLLCIVVIIVMNACIAGSPLTQSHSPISASTATLLVGQRWEIVEITFRGESVPFDALKPFNLWFEQVGSLNFTSTHCAGGAFLIFFENERHYKLTRGEIGAVGCGELETNQFDRVLEAMAKTTMYEIRNKQLFLTGEDVQIILEVVDTH